MATGLHDLVVTSQHEVARRGDADFETRAGVWTHVAATRGRQMVADGAVTERERAQAERDYRDRVSECARSHTQYLLAVEGVRPYTPREA